MRKEMKHTLFGRKCERKDLLFKRYNWYRKQGSGFKDGTGVPSIGDTSFGANGNEA